RRKDGWEPLLGHSFIECLISTGHEDSEDSYNKPLNLSKVNTIDRSPGNEMDSLLIIEKDKCPETEERGDGVSQEFQCPRYHDVSLRGHSSANVPKDKDQPEVFRPQKTEDSQNCETDHTCESHQERSSRVPKTHQCVECLRTFRYPSQILAHQRGYKERTFIFL
ncbi:hypothetical protein ACQP3J_26485, partial [Escherichia coli]